MLAQLRWPCRYWSFEAHFHPLWRNWRRGGARKGTTCANPPTTEIAEFYCQALWLVLLNICILALNHNCMWDPIYHTHSHITHTQPLTLITHAVCLWCARARGVLSMRFISAAVPISRDVSYLLSCDIAIPWLCERLHVHVLTNAHPYITHNQTWSSSVFDVSRATKLSEVWAPPACLLWTWKLYSSVTKSKPHPRSTPPPRLFTKVGVGFMHVCVRVGIFCL